MADVQWITAPGRAEAVAQELNSGQRTRPAVVVSTPSGVPAPWIDPERLAGELGGLADVYVLSSLESSWAFSTAMPPRTQVYGGAGRVYSVDLDWVHNPARSRLRFTYSAAEGEAATTRLIEDGLAAALHDGLLAPRDGSQTAREVTAVVRGCPTTSQALVAVGGGYASIQVGLAVPGVSSERVFAVGMQVRGLLDQVARRLDVRSFLPSPAARLAEIGNGDVIWAQVESVGTSSCEIAPYPGAAVRVSWEEVTASAADDLHDLMSVGEVVAVRASRCADGTLALSLVGFDETDFACSALAVFPGGPPWLLPPEPAAIPRPDDAYGRDEAVRPPTPVVTETTGSTPALVMASADSPQAQVDSPRPTPLLIGRQRGPHLVRPRAADPGAPVEQGRGEALRGMSLQLETARARGLLLEAAVKTAESNLRSTRTQMRMLERDLSDQVRDLAAREADLRRLRARIRKNVQEERRLAGRREVAPGEDLFLDPGEQFRFEVMERWVRRIPAAEKADRPLRAYGFGPRFLDSLCEIQGVDRSKVADVVVDVLTGLAESSAGRDMHPLRSGTGGDDEVLRREAYTCWRVAIQRRTPQARRLHFWRSADNIELSRVVLHDDYAP